MEYQYSIVSDAVGGPRRKLLPERRDSRVARIAGVNVASHGPGEPSFLFELTSSFIKQIVVHEKQLPSIARPYTGWVLF